MYLKIEGRWEAYNILEIVVIPQHSESKNNYLIKFQAVGISVCCLAGQKNSYHSGNRTNIVSEVTDFEFALNL